VRSVEAIIRRAAASLREGLETLTVMPWELPDSLERALPSIPRAFALLPHSDQAARRQGNPARRTGFYFHERDREFVPAFWTKQSAKPRFS